MNRLLLCLLLAVSFSVTAQVYKSVDENGNTVFSDTPPAGNSEAEKVQLGTTNSAPPPPIVHRPQKTVVAEEGKVEISVEIASPAPETTIAIGYAGNFSVTAKVTPPMANGQTAQLLMDGDAIGRPQSRTSWALSNIFRGAHSLSVVISDARGEHLAVSPPITVYVLRTMVRR